MLERFLKNRNCEPQFLQRDRLMYCIKTPKESESSQHYFTTLDRTHEMLPEFSIIAARCVVNRCASRGRRAWRRCGEGRSRRWDGRWWWTRRSWHRTHKPSRRFSRAVSLVEAFSQSPFDGDQWIHSVSFIRATVIKSLELLLNFTLKLWLQGGSFTFIF